MGILRRDEDPGRPPEEICALPNHPDTMAALGATKLIEMSELYYQTLRKRAEAADKRNY